MTNKQIANYHKVISDPVRWQIIELIKFNNGVTVQDLINKFKLTKPTLSFHMKKLLSVKAVLAVKKNKILYYYPNKETLEKIFNVMEKMVDQALLNKFNYQFTEKEILNTYLLYSDPIRFKILNFVIEQPASSGKQIKAFTGKSEANVSFHLEKLIEGGVIIGKKIGNQHYYWPNEGFLISFHNFIRKTRNKNIWNKK